MLQHENEGFASAITVAELSVGGYRTGRKEALEKTLELLSIVNIVDLNKEIAIKGGEIYSALTKLGEEIELNDCLIVATAIHLGIYEIVTRDIKHFSRIRDIKPIAPEELGF